MSGLVLGGKMNANIYFINLVDVMILMIYNDIRLMDQIYGSNGGT